MTRRETITELKNYFSIQELVCQHTYSTFGEVSWQFLDTEILHILLVLRRDVFKVEMYINNWANHKGGPLYDERGFRCNLCDLCRQKTMANQIYLTSHANGAAFDAEVKGMTAEQARILIKEKANLLPYQIRIEKGVNWLHVDKYVPNGVMAIVTEFSV